MINRRGFTLVELMIVIVIIALLVTIVLGRYKNLSKEAKYSQVGSNLIMLRASIARFYANNDRYPTLSEMQQLAASSSLEDSPDEVSIIGDYIQGIPNTPRFRSVENDTVYEAANEVTATYSGDGGWVYDENRGVIYPDIPETQFGADDWHRENSNF